MGIKICYKVELPEGNDFLQGSEQTKSRPLPEKLNAWENKAWQGKCQLLPKPDITNYWEIWVTSFKTFSNKSFVWLFEKVCDEQTAFPPPGCLWLHYAKEQGCLVTAVHRNGWSCIN